MNKILKNDKINMLLVFCIVFIVRLIFIALYAMPLRTPMDELCTISTGVYFGGKDWTALTSFSKYYYGGGFTIMFAPLFKMIESPFAIYKIMLSVCAVLQSISAPISYYILNKCLKINNKIYLFLAAITSSFMVVTRTMEVYNEHMLIAISWLSALILVKLIQNLDNYKKKSIYSVLLMLLLCYSLTVHTRAKTMLIALIVVVAAYFIAYRKWLLAKIPGAISLVIGYFLANRFVFYIKTNVWLWKEGDYLKNTSVSFGGLQFEDLLSPVSWQAWLDIILGQINTITIFTGGVSLIIIVILVKCIWLKLVEIFSKSKKLFVEDDILINIEPYFLTIGTFFFLCIGATIFAQSFTWLKGVMMSLEESAYATNAYDYKAITYIRYMGPYLGPIFMVGIGYIYHYKEKLKALFWPFILTYGITQVIWVVYIIPHIYQNRTASEVFWAFGLQKFQDDTTLKTYMAGVAVSLIIFFAAAFLYRAKKVFIPLCILCVLFIYEYAYGAVYWDNAWAEKYIVRADYGYNLIGELESNGETLPDEIYVKDTTSGVQKRVYTYQFLLNQYTIIPQVPDKSIAEAIVFCNKPNYEELIENGYKWSKIDDDEYLYVKGEKYISMFENLDVLFKN